METNPKTFIAKTPLELARKEYHDATVEMADLDARLIDAAASLEELKDRHGKSIIRVNEARAKLVDARSPPQNRAATVIDRREQWVAALSDAAFIQDLIPRNPKDGDLWVRPAAREVLKFQQDDWQQLQPATFEIGELFTVDELRALRPQETAQAG